VAFVIDYPLVLDALRERGMRCVYYNGGAFEFVDASTVHLAGWVLADDPTLRPAARAVARLVHPPDDETLVRRFLSAWRRLANPRVWVMPASHWAYELDFGHADALPPLLDAIGVDAGQLQPRTNASAIELGGEEEHALERLLLGLLSSLHGSDFTLAFPDLPTLCTVHHHRQLWWRTADPDVAAVLRSLDETVPPLSASA
jgi:hypothetical protein